MVCLRVCVVHLAALYSGSADHSIKGSNVYGATTWEVKDAHTYAATACLS